MRVDKEMKTEYNDAAKKLALSENMGASPEIEKEIHSCSWESRVQGTR